MSEVSEPVLLRAARMIVSSGRLSCDDDQEAWDMVCALGHDSMPLAKAYISAMELLIVREGMSDAEGTARAMLGATGSYPTKQIESIISGLLDDIDKFRKDSGRAALMDAVTLEYHEIEQVLAQALGGYSKYADDPKAFPGVRPDDPTVFVGFETPLELATQAAEEIKKLRTDRDALLTVLDPLLVAVEPVRSALVKDIDKQVEAKQEWAKHYNATCGNSNEMWFYSTEFKRSLEREVEPFAKAIREANEVYDRIKGQGQCSG